MRHTKVCFTDCCSIVWPGTENSDAPLHHPLLWSRGCLLTASLVVSSVFQPLHVLSVLCLALPTARHAAPTAAALSSLGITGESLAGSLTHDACACDASLGPPPLRKCSRLLSHPRVLLHRVGHYNRIQLPSQSIPH